MFLSRCHVPCTRTTIRTSISVKQALVRTCAQFLAPDVLSFDYFSMTILICAHNNFWRGFYHAHASTARRQLMYPFALTHPATASQFHVGWSSLRSLTHLPFFHLLTSSAGGVWLLFPSAACVRDFSHSFSSHVMTSWMWSADCCHKHCKVCTTIVAPVALGPDSGHHSPYPKRSRWDNSVMSRWLSSTGRILIKVNWEMLIWFLCWATDQEGQRTSPSPVPASTPFSVPVCTKLPALSRLIAPFHPMTSHSTVCCNSMVSEDCAFSLATSAHDVRTVGVSKNCRRSASPILHINLVDFLQDKYRQLFPRHNPACVGHVLSIFHAFLTGIR